MVKTPKTGQYPFNGLRYQYHVQIKTYYNTYGFIGIKFFTFLKMGKGDHFNDVKPPISGLLERKIYLLDQ